MNLYLYASQPWRRLRGSDRFAECLRVFFALAGISLFCLWRNQNGAMIPAMLGAIACALAETEDHWRSRISTLLVTLGCFAFVAIVVGRMLPFPFAFACVLPLMTFALVMLGAISPRYATIGSGTLILAVYTMIGTDQSAPPVNKLVEPVQLLAGAAWYGALSLLWSIFSPQVAVRHALARVFDALADYMDGKAALFTPIRDADRNQLNLALAMRNEQVVEALNDTRIVLIDRIGMRRPRGATAARLQRYFLAQDIHERISSSHYPYDVLVDAFYHSDVLFRCERLLRLEALQCRQHADALRQRIARVTDSKIHIAVADLRTSIDALHSSSTPIAEHLLRPLDALLRNVTAIQTQLEQSTTNNPPSAPEDSALQNPGPQSLREAWARITTQLTPRSSRFRHALRLALALMVGYAVLLAVHPLHGYWILLTTMLICQPSYGATLRRMLQRVAGTVIGVVIGWAVLRLLPGQAWEMSLIVISGVMFFAARLRGYTLATAAITLFVVLCFNQAGNGYEVMWPRLLDTLIGAVIAALSIYLVLPDWQGRQLDQVLSQTLRNNARYLKQVITQYTLGKRDDLPYRIARREAHNADAALSGILSNMLREPGRPHKRNEALLRFLAISHTTLGHISTLGAHREAIALETVRTTINRYGSEVLEKMNDLATTVERGKHKTIDVIEASPSVAIEDKAIDGETAHLVIAQLGLISAQRERLAAIVEELHDDD